MRKTMRVLRLSILGATNYVASSWATAQSPSNSPGWYTTAQAASGAKAYQKACSSCHGAKLQGGMATALAGRQFWLNYGGKKVSTLWSTVHTEMPMSARPARSRPLARRISWHFSCRRTA